MTDIYKLAENDFIKNSYYCGDPCLNIKCKKHISNRLITIGPCNVTSFKDTDTCPLKAESFEEGTIGNVVQSKHSPASKLIACKCPYCKAIFTLEFSSNYEFRTYGSFKDNCPVCGEKNDWLVFRIPVFWYKWLRYIRRNKDE